MTTWVTWGTEHSVLTPWTSGFAIFYTCTEMCNNAGFVFHVVRPKLIRIMLLILLRFLLKHACVCVCVWQWAVLCCRIFIVGGVNNKVKHKWRKGCLCLVCAADAVVGSGRERLWANCGCFPQYNCSWLELYFPNWSHGSQKKDFFFYFSRSSNIPLCKNSCIHLKVDTPYKQNLLWI